MKYKKWVIVLLITNIILIGIIYNLLNSNVRSIKEKQVLKEMNTSEREEELNKKITELNSSSTEYATYVQNCKAQIASAITEKGVSTNETDTVDVIVENIKNISSDTTHTLYIVTGYHHIGNSWDTSTFYTTVYIDGVSTYTFTGYSGFVSDEFTI